MTIPDGPEGARLALDPPGPSIQIDRGGCHRVEDEWQGMSMAHPSIGFYLVDEAGMEAIDDHGRHWPFDPRGITVIPPWFAYTYRFTPAMRHAYLHIAVPAWPAALLQQCWPQPLVLRERGLRRIFLDYAATITDGAAPAQQQLAARRLGHACLHALLASDPTAAAALLTGDHPWLQLGAALELVERELHRPLAVGELAAALGVGREHCSRLFRRHLGTSPVHYIQQRRVARAMELLSHATATLDEIAQACGCGSRQHLTRLFRRYVHARPSDWRGR